MVSRFPPTGDFSDFSIHEMFMHLITDHFSGSLELDYSGTNRNFHFDNGHLCAASSNHPEEQLDNLLEKNRGPSFSEAEKAKIKQRTDAGLTYGKALVDAGLISATDLLGFSKKMAEVILEGGMSEVPGSYRLTESESAKYRPLPFDPLTFVLKTMLVSLDLEVVKKRLGDEDSRYILSDQFDKDGSAVIDNAEVQLVVPHLDGKRSVRDLTKRIGLNPDRTSIILLFLKWAGWIKPVSSAEITEDIEKPDKQVASDLAARYNSEEMDYEEDSADILRLLEEDEEDTVEIETSPEGFSTYDDLGTEIPGPSFKENLDGRLGVESKPTDQTEISSDGETSLSGKNLLDRKTTRILLLYVLPAVVCIALVIVFSLMFLGPPGSGAGTGGEEMSFYPKEVDQSQLPLDKDFQEGRQEILKPVEIQVDPDAQEEDFSDSDLTAETESEPEVDDRSPVTPDETQLQIEAVDRIVEPAVSTWEEALPIALEQGVSGRWREAADIWSGPASSQKGNVYTLLIVKVENEGYVSSVFEKFANNSVLREQFFILGSGTDNNVKFNICWGIFPDLQAALAASRNLPTRIREYGPTTRLLGELLDK